MKPREFSEDFEFPMIIKNSGEFLKGGGEL